MSEPADLLKLMGREYQQRIVVERLRRDVFGQTDPSTSGTMEDLIAAEEALSALELERSEVQSGDPGSGLILDTTARDQENPVAYRGFGTTGLEAKVHLKMAHIPTAICHLFNAGDNPLIACTVSVESGGKLASPKRIRVTSFIEGYSAQAVNTFEVPPGKQHTFQQLPTLLPERVKNLTELTRATLNVLVEDLDREVEIHETQPVWLLARTSAPLAVQDPQTGHWQNLGKYFGAFVTPNAPSLMTFLREAARRHPQGMLVGYQGESQAVEPQIKALFEALKEVGGITYVNSLVDFNPQQGWASQRMRLPRESLADKQANCIDGTVLFASLLEGISLNPAIVLIPGHAFVAWETWNDSNDWRFLETTMIGSHSFEEAMQSGGATAKQYLGKLEILPLKKLRVEHGIFPME